MLGIQAGGRDKVTALMELIANIHGKALGWTFIQILAEDPIMINPDRYEPLAANLFLSPIKARSWNSGDISVPPPVALDAHALSSVGFKLGQTKQPHSHFFKFFPYRAIHISILRAGMVGIRQEHTV